jgi:hypothetical protein
MPSIPGVFEPRLGYRLCVLLPWSRTSTVAGVLPNLALRTSFANFTVFFLGTTGDAELLVVMDLVAVMMNGLLCCYRFRIVGERVCEAPVDLWLSNWFMRVVSHQRGKTFNAPRNAASKVLPDIFRRTLRYGQCLKYVSFVPLIVCCGHLLYWLYHTGTFTFIFNCRQNHAR